MKKLLLILLLLILLTGCNKLTIDPFKELINNYPHNPNKLSEYKEIYNETANIIYAINKVNYPYFLKPNSTTYLAFKSDDIFFVNTNYLLRKNYVPSNLTTVVNVDYIKRDNQTMLIDSTTLDAYKELFNASLKENLQLTIFSAYRSYEYQESLYNKENNSYVAAPGTSEHQTGTALDIATLNTGLTIHFDLSKEAIWLKNNAYKYGFIERYPKDKEHITGYPYESWHYRFVGIEMAKIIHEQNLTLEEYFYQYVIL